jgi:hypothetical protein
MTIFIADGNPTNTNAYRSSAISNMMPGGSVILTFPRIVCAQAVPRVTDINATGTISGALTNAAGPLANARVMLMQDGNSRDDRVLSTTTDGSGNYSFTKLPAGNYIVVPFDPTGAYRSKVIHTVVP